MIPGPLLASPWSKLAKVAPSGSVIIHGPNWANRNLSKPILTVSPTPNQPASGSAGFAACRCASPPPCRPFSNGAYREHLRLEVGAAEHDAHRRLHPGVDAEHACARRRASRARAAAAPMIMIGSVPDVGAPGRAAPSSAAPPPQPVQPRGPAFVDGRPSAAELRRRRARQPHAERRERELQERLHREVVAARIKAKRLRLLKASISQTGNAFATWKYFWKSSPHRK